MSVALAEAHDLVLDRRAIARSAARDLPGIHRRAMHVRPDDLVRRRRRARDAAFDLRRFNRARERRERLGRIVARLHFHRRPVDRGAVDSRRRSGLEPAERETEPLERERKPKRRRLADTAGRRLLLADVDQAAQKGPGGEHHRGAFERTTVDETNAAHGIIDDDQIVRLAFDHREIFGRTDRALHRRGVELPVGLGARPAHRRSLATVQNAELDAALVGDPPHQAVERVDLAHQMPFTEPADRRIARHRPDGRKPMRHQRGSGAHTGSRGRSLAAGVPAANDDDVEGHDAGILPE